MPIRQIIFCALLPLLFLYSNPLAKNVTRYIDDSYGDLVTGFKPTYYPADGIWQDQSCNVCWNIFDTRQSHNRTYTAATYQQNMDTMGFSLQFQGTGISVYFILGNDGHNTTTRTECNFILDGSPEKSYVHQPLPGRADEYNAKVFKKEGLENRLHTLNVDTGKLDHSVYIVFDYAAYT
ncbi:hypothetical protein AAF712_010430, partial [Marasmius tenuissimus]